MKIELKCDQCGKKLFKIPAKVAEHNFCNRQCFGQYKKTHYHMSEEVKQKISNSLLGKKHPEVSKLLKGKIGPDSRKWKKSGIKGQTGRHRAQRYFPIQPCEVCGVSNELKRIHRHHVDGNTENNLPENIRFLCTKHHAQIHKEERMKCHQFVD